MLWNAPHTSISGEAETDQAEGDVRVAELLKVNASLDKVDFSRPLWIRVQPP